MQTNGSATSTMNIGVLYKSLAAIWRQLEEPWVPEDVVPEGIVDITGTYGKWIVVLLFGSPSWFQISGYSGHIE